MNIFSIAWQSRHSLTRFDPGGKFLLSLHSPHLISWSQMWQSGGGRFRRVLLREGIPPRLPPQMNRLMMYLRCHTVGFWLALRRCVTRDLLQRCHTVLQAQILYVAGYSVHQDGLWTNHFGHRTFAEFCGTSILRCLEPHAIPYLVRAASGTWRRYRGFNPFNS